MAVSKSSSAKPASKPAETKPKAKAKSESGSGKSGAAAQSSQGGASADQAGGADKKPNAKVSNLLEQLKTFDQDKNGEYSRQEMAWAALDDFQQNGGEPSDEFNLLATIVTRGADGQGLMPDDDGSGGVSEDELKDLAAADQDADSFSPEDFKAVFGDQANSEEVSTEETIARLVAIATGQEEEAAAEEAAGEAGAEEAAGAAEEAAGGGGGEAAPAGAAGGAAPAGAAGGAAPAGAAGGAAPAGAAGGAAPAGAANPAAAPQGAAGAAGAGGTADVMTLVMTLMTLMMKLTEAAQGKSSESPAAIMEQIKTVMGQLMQLLTGQGGANPAGLTMAQPNPNGTGFPATGLTTAQPNPNGFNLANLQAPSANGSARNQFAF